MDRSWPLENRMRSPRPLAGSPKTIAKNPNPPHSLSTPTPLVIRQILETRNLGQGMPTTRWSLIDAAGGDATRRQQALEHFARDYWPAVYAYVRCRGHSPPEAEDLTQAFLISLIERDSLATVTEGDVRFRSWLLSALKHFLINDWRDKTRLKRGGGAPHLSIDGDLGEIRVNLDNFADGYESFVIARTDGEIERLIDHSFPEN